MQYANPSPSSSLTTTHDKPSDPPSRVSGDQSRLTGTLPVGSTHTPTIRPGNMGLGDNREESSGGGGGGEGEKSRGKRRKIAKACLACQRSHLTCDERELLLIISYRRVGEAWIMEMVAIVWDFEDAAHLRMSLWPDGDVRKGLGLSISVQRWQRGDLDEC
jgi:hypothetical protein